RRTRPRGPAPVTGRGAAGGHFDQGKTSGGRSSRNRLPDCVSTPPGSLARPPLPEPAVFLVNLLSLTVAGARLSRPPPWMLAMLSVRVLSITVTVRELGMPPPLPPPRRPAVAELPVKVQPITVAVRRVRMPPPEPPKKPPGAELPVKVLSIT